MGGGGVMPRNYCLENGLPKSNNVTTFINYHSQVLLTLTLQQLQPQNQLLDFHVTKSHVSFDRFGREAGTVKADIGKH